MNTLDVVNMQKRPPHKTDVLANAVFGDQTPEIFREGKYYEKGNLTYTYDDSNGNIDVWECMKSGIYGRPTEPSWVVWSMDEVRTRLTNLEAFIGSQDDIYNIQSYERSYMIHDVGVRDWEKRGSFLEAFNAKKYLAKKHYTINDEIIVPANSEEPLPTEAETTLYLGKSNNRVTNLIRRVETYGKLGEDGRIKIPFPVDMSLIGSYIFDLYIDGVYISQNFIDIEKEGEWDRYVTIEFDGKIPTEFDEMINDGTLELVNPIETIMPESECVFVFYISISHDLTLLKTDYDKFVGDARDGKWIDIVDLDFQEKYQEMHVYNNGIRMTDKEYSINQNRINIDNPDYRFRVGAFATASMKTFKVAVDDVVANVKEETVPIFEENTKLLAIPFLNYDETEDHFLVFNDGGILLGNQRWFEDNGFINVYDDDAGLTPNDMVEFRMISRDKNMEIRTYPLLTTIDNQTTYSLPLRLKDCYFHMLFTENGQYISRTKYAVSGTILQFRDKYATLLEGDRLELICFDYVGEYGFTSMMNYKSNWNPDYSEVIIDTLPPAGNPEAESDEGETEECGGSEDTPVVPPLDYEPITNPDGIVLEFTPPEPPGTRYELVQDVATNTLKSAITRSEVSLVIGVDCDNQIICTTYYGDILRFNRKGIEDSRYKLKEVSNNTIDMLDTDDFGYSYFHTYATLHITKADRNGDKVWEFRAEDCTEPIAYIRSIKYIDGYLYIEYSPYGIVEYTTGRIHAETGVFSTIPIIMPEDHVYQWSSKISHLNNDHIYIGSNGHVIYEFEKSGLFVRKYTDLVEDFNTGNVIDVYCDGEDGNVYAISQSPIDYSSQLIKYASDGTLLFVKQYYGEIQMTFDSDGFIYLFDAASLTISKLNKEDGEPIWVYTFVSGISDLNGFFVDPVDYHVYAYYVNNNVKDDMYRYVELEQNGLPIPKYRHEIVFNCDENVTNTDLIGTTTREINLLSTPTNRLYIGTMDGSIYTYTQAMREMSKGRTVKLWGEENNEIPVHIIPDDEYNFYVIKGNIIEKWNRYERMKWRYDGIGIMTSVLRQIALNPVSKDLVFIYGDTDGRHSLGKIDTDGEFEPLEITLPNGVRVEDGDCSITCSTRGDYFFGYSGKTIYRYSQHFNPLATYGMNTADLLDGPVGSVVIDKNNQYVYATVKNRSDEDIFDKVIKFNPVGTVVWEHNFYYSCTHGSLLIDKDNNVYVCDEREIRKIDTYGNYVWRFKFEEELVTGGEPNFIIMDEFYRIFFMDKEYNIHRIDQYNLTLNPIPDEEPEPPEPIDPIDPDTPDIPDEYIRIQRRFDLPFTFDRSTSGIMVFTNTGAYVGKRFYDIYDKQIVLKGSPIYENGWLDIILIENVKESIII